MYSSGFREIELGSRLEVLQKSAYDAQCDVVFIFAFTLYIEKLSNSIHVSWGCIPGIRLVTKVTSLITVILNGM